MNTNFIKINYAKLSARPLEDNKSRVTNCMPVRIKVPAEMFSKDHEKFHVSSTEFGHC
jgi:hypothetical protein